MKTNTGITEQSAKSIAEILNTLLSDEYVLLTKTRNYHWHVTGSSFMEMHRLYEGQYDTIREMIDEIAERVTQLGQKATATMKEFLAQTRLKEGPYHSEQDKQVKQLLADHEAISRHLREDISKIEEEHDDPVTVDMLTNFLGTHEKTAWMLRSYLA